MVSGLIKTDDDYARVLSRIDEIMDAEPGTPDFDELELLSALVDLYEEEHFPIDLPDPVSAIQFRMEQLDLTAQNLVPFIGSRSKVSEVLNGKRPLSLSMMRALNKELGIPADILLNEPEAEFPDSFSEMEWKKFPVKEMINKKFFPETQNVNDKPEEIMRDLIRQAGGIDSVYHCMFKRSPGGRVNVKNDPYATSAWCLKVLALANARPLPIRYRKNTVNKDFLKEAARLSHLENGPLLAKEYIENHGIHFVVFPHLKKTYIDGAVAPLADGTPVIGLTLRYDRIDNFWFCLLHELAHIAKHFSDDPPAIIIDDLDLRGTVEREAPGEIEADNMAQNALIPEKEWRDFFRSPKITKHEVIHFAGKLRIHPAIVAGRIRYERNNYKLFSGMVGYNEIRKHFKGAAG